MEAFLLRKATTAGETAEVRLSPSLDSLSLCSMGFTAHCRVLLHRQSDQYYKARKPTAKLHRGLLQAAEHLRQHIAQHIAPRVRTGLELYQELQSSARLLPTGCSRCPAPQLGLACLTTLVTTG